MGRKELDMVHNNDKPEVEEETTVITEDDTVTK